MRTRIYVLIGATRKPLEMATENEMREYDRVVVAKNGEEKVLTQAQMRTNVLLMCRQYHLPFSLAV